MEPVNLKSNISSAPDVLMGDLNTRKTKQLPWRATVAFGLFVGVFAIVNASFISPPSNFLSGTMITVGHGDGVSRVADKLEQAHVIKNAFAFRVAMKFQTKAKVEEGPYVFSSPMPVFAIATIMSISAHGITEVTIPIPEGWTRKKVADRFAARIAGFDRTSFLSLTEDKEGYLFPDTYKFYINATSGVVVAAMKKNFDKRTAELQKEAQTKSRDWKDVVILASILEGEGSSAPGERAMIADILLRRMQAHMRLQVDAPFLFILGKGSRELTRDDLFIDSPYNTYRNEGLPPGPIGSPGLESIKAALSPIPNEYLFYLHDKNGVIHYAKTSAEHTKNKMLYLR